MPESEYSQTGRQQIRADEELQRTGELLRVVADAVNDAIFVKDRTGKYLLLNKAACRLVGKSAAEVLGRDDSELFDRDKARVVMEGDQRIMESGLAERQEEELTAAGLTRTYLMTRAPYRDKNGKVSGVIGLGCDVTDRKRAEASLRDREELFQFLTEKTNDFIRLHDLTGRSIYCSPSVERFHGRPPKTLFEFEAADDDEVCRQWWQRVLAGSNELLYWRVRNKADAWTWLETRASIVPYQGKPHVMTVCRDVTDRKRSEEILGEKERMLRQILDALPVGVAVVDPSGNIILANPASERLWGTVIATGSERYCKSKGWWHGTGKQIEPDEWPSVRACKTGQTSVDELIEIEGFDGVRRVIRNSTVPIWGDDQSITGAVVVNEDVTESMRFQAERYSLLQRLRLQIDRLPLAYILLDMDYQILDWNPAAHRIFGYSKAEALGRLSNELINSTRLRDQFREQIRRMEAGDMQSQYVNENRTKDGRTITCEWFNTPLISADGKISGLVLLAQDITDRRRTDEALKRSSERLELLSRRIVEIQEEERRHLARELHDEIGQILSAIHINLQIAIESCDANARLRLEESIAIVDQAVQQVHNLSLDLRPSMLDDLGLVSTLRWFANRQAKRVGFNLHFTAESTGRRLPINVESTCYRVVQEALTNVTRHAKANQVWLSFEEHDNEVWLEIRDDGLGFDVAGVHERAVRGVSFGVLGMRERVELLGGTIEIQSQPGHGTTIRVRVPIETRPQTT